MKLIEASRFLGAAMLVGTLAACGGKGNSDKEFVTFPTGPAQGVPTQVPIELGQTFSCPSAPKKEEIFLLRGQEVLIRRAGLKFNGPGAVSFRGPVGIEDLIPDRNGTILNLSLDQGIRAHVVAQNRATGAHVSATFTCLN